MKKNPPTKLKLAKITPDGKRTFVSLIILVVLLIAMMFIKPDIMKPTRLATITNAQMCLLLAGIGQTLVLLVGGIDLSVGGVICLTNSLAALYLPDSFPGILAMCLGITVLGLAIGAFNGFIITKFNVQPFVVTFTVNYILLGISLHLLPLDGGEPPKAFCKALTAKFGVLSVSLFMVIAIIVGWMILRRTRFIRELFAVGTNAKAAALNGIKVTRVKLLAFALSGGFAALGGIYRTAQIASGSPTAGDALTMPSITISVIGGTSMAGGLGGVVGTVIGAYILRIISDILTFVGAKSFWSTVFQGVFLVVTVTICSLLDMRKGGKKRG